MTRTYKVTGPTAALACVVLLAFIALFAYGMGVIFSLLWNAFVPGAFGLSPISFNEGFVAVLLLWFVGSFFKRGK